MRICFFLALIITTTLQSVAQRVPDMESLTGKHDLGNAAISIMVADTENDSLLFGYNARMSLTPASVQKLLTTAAALKILGPDGHFKTSVGYSGKISPGGTLRGDIIISGGGDPALGSPHFSEHYGDFIGDWAKAISGSGIKKIIGNIIAVDTCFTDPPVNRRWFWEDIGNYWGAGSWGLSLFENSYTILLRTGKEGSVPEITGMTPAIPGLILENRLAASGQTDNGYVFLAPGSLNGRIEGTIPVERDTFRLRASIPDPPLIAASMLRERLIANGVKIKGEALSDKRSQVYHSIDFIQVTETVSPAYGDIITITNRESKNLFADNLLRQTGRMISGSSGFKESTEAIVTLLNNEGIGSGDIFMEDGSGLSQLNSVSSMAVTRLLLNMSHSDHSALFLESLPVGGVSGTLKNRFTDPLFSGRVFAKTGSSTRVRSLAGYLITDSGHKLAFSIIVNNYSTTTSSVHIFMEEFVKEIITNY